VGLSISRYADTGSPFADRKQRQLNLAESMRGDANHDTAQVSKKREQDRNPIVDAE